MALARARRPPADQRGVLLRLLLDAVAAALIATVLALPLVGVETVEGGGAGLEIHTRFDWVLLGASAVLSGRLVLRFWRLAPGLPGPLRRQSALIAMLFIPAWWAATHPALPAWWRDIDGALPLPAWAWLAIAADLLIGAWWLGSFGAAGRRILLPVAPRVAATPNRYSFAFGAVGVAIAIAWPFLPFSSRYLTDMATSVLIYVMLGWGLNVVVGLAGLLDLGYVAFYAVGAYSFALFAQWFDLSFWQALPIAGILAASFGVILGFPVLRLRGDYLAIVTLGFGEIIRIILINWYNVTGGPNGINGIPRPTFFGLPLQPRAPEGVVTFHQFFGIAFNPDQRIIFLYYVILALALTTNFFTLRLRKLPIGRAWEALREDEIACRALGINPTNVKLSAFAIGAMLGGFAGAFFATRQGFISPESFTFLESATILAIVVLGGMGSQLGVVLAAIVLVTLPEFGREFAQFRMLVFGAAMVGIMVWRPRGLIASREPSLRLHGRTARAQEGA